MLFDIFLLSIDYITLFFCLKLNFKLEIYFKTYNFKNLEEILKTWRKFARKHLATLYIKF